MPSVAGANSDYHVHGWFLSHLSNRNGYWEALDGRNSEMTVVLGSARPTQELQRDHVDHDRAKGAAQRCICVRLESWLLSSHHLCPGHEEEAGPFLRYVIAAGLEDCLARGASN